MPPFGPLYRQRVFVDAALAAESEVVFNAGTNSEAIRMRYADFAAATTPTVGRGAPRLATILLLICYQAKAVP